MTKKCPACGVPIGFGRFLLRCGSDTLVEHTANGPVHRREHICPRCHKKFWFQYNRRALKRHAQALLPGLMLSGAAVVLVAKIIFNAADATAVYLFVLFLFAAGPLAMAWDKYESSFLKADEEAGPDKTAPGPDGICAEKQITA